MTNKTETRDLTTSDEIPSTEQVIHNNIRREQLKLVLSVFRPSVLAAVLIASVTTFVLWGQVNQAALITWYALQVTLSLLRIRMCSRLQFNLDEADDADIQRRMRRFSVSALAASMLWGVTPFLVFPAGDIEYQVFVIFILVGITAGALSSQSAVFPLVRRYVMITMTPLAGLLLLAPYKVSTAMGLMVASYIVFVLINAKRTSNNIIDNIVLRYRGQLRETELEKLRLGAEQANRAKSQFLANMSHELRTPMNGVLGACELLGMSELNDEQRGYVTTIHRSGNTLLALLNDLLDFSKIEAGKMELENRAFDLDAVICHLSQLLEGPAKSKGIGFTVAKSDEVAHYLYGDQQRILQVVLNLLSNAIKFTEQGEVGLSVSLLDDGKKLHFEITDSGIGIPLEKQHLLFNKFQQMESSTARKFGGTGLGLAISKQLVTIMGGDVGVVSELGKGSCFWFDLPYQPASDEAIKELLATAGEEAGAKGHTMAQPATSYRLLLAEDNEINRIIARAMLGKIGFTNVDMVEDGNQALEKLALNDYDLVLMDVQMPECDGLEATRRIRGIGAYAGKDVALRNRSIPIVALTANAMESDIAECLAAGMNAHVSKPIDLHALEATLREWLDD